MGAPARAQNQALPRCESRCNSAEVGHGDQRPGSDAVELHQPGRAHTLRQRHLVDRPVASLDVRGRIHVRSAVGIEVKRLRVPAVFAEVELRFTCDPSHTGAQRQRKIDDTVGGTVSGHFFPAGFDPGC
jgi:hypothetical protein